MERRCSLIVGTTYLDAARKKTIRQKPRTGASALAQVYQSAVIVRLSRVAGRSIFDREMSKLVRAAIVVREAVAEAQRRFHEIHRLSFARMGPSLADPPQFTSGWSGAVFFAESALSIVVR
jgi:hypothetical protein